MGTSKKKDLVSVSKIPKNAIVEKQNALNEMKNNLSYQETRIWQTYLAKINARDDSTIRVQIYVDDYFKYFGIQSGTKKINYLKKVTDALVTKSISIPVVPGKNLTADVIEESGYATYPIFSECKVYKDDSKAWILCLEANPKIKGLLFNMSKNYMNYTLAYTVPLKSVYHIRLYELLKQYEFQGSFEISIIKLKEKLGIDINKYSNGDFNRYILSPAKREIEKHTDIQFTFQPGKRGAYGTWHNIIFTISKNEENISKFDDMKKISQIKEVPITTTTKKTKTKKLPSAKEPLQNDYVSLSEDEKKQLYTNEHENLLIYAHYVNYEFPPDETQVLRDLLWKIHPDVTDEYTYSIILHEKYNEMEERSKKRKITNRLAYLKKMIQAD
jgi:plasmid replication initiation protein